MLVLVASLKVKGVGGTATGNDSASNEQDYTMAKNNA